MAGKWIKTVLGTVVAAVIIWLLTGSCGYLNPCHKVVTKISGNLYSYNFQQITDAWPSSDENVYGEYGIRRIEGINSVTDENGYFELDFSNVDKSLFPIRIMVGPVNWENDNSFYDTGVMLEYGQVRKDVKIYMQGRI